MNFIDTLDNSPTDLIGSKYGVVVFAAEDFDDWCESLAIAHDDEVYIASNAYLEDIPDERLTKNGLVRLPVDADGVPINVGDVMEWPYGNGEFIVEGIGGNTLFYIDKDSNECEWTAAGDKRHHYKPTVEERLSDEEVVRCRDCACFSVDDSDHDYRTGWWCKRWYTDMVMPDGFCAWGKRRESE